MAYSAVKDLLPPSHAHGKPRLLSYDSGAEFSFERWSEVCKLAELAEEDDRGLKGCVFDDSLLDPYDTRLEASAERELVSQA